MCFTPAFFNRDTGSTNANTGGSNFFSRASDTNKPNNGGGSSFFNRDSGAGRSNTGGNSFFNRGDNTRTDNNNRYESNRYESNRYNSRHVKEEEGSFPVEYKSTSKNIDRAFESKCIMSMEEYSNFSVGRTYSSL